MSQIICHRCEKESIYHLAPLPIGQSLQRWNGEANRSRKQKISDAAEARCPPATYGYTLLTAAAIATAKMWVNKMSVSI